MSRAKISVLILIVFLFSLLPAVSAAEPSYVVLNFSEMNKLNWAASENEWNTQVKPKVMEQLKNILTLEKGTADRKLAWSTLMEFMNIPMDTPSEQSVYAIKLTRILDLAEELNVPVYVPFNTFQWWDELPELYNWWDPDGTHTSDVFFKRQTSPDFKKRFIAGYNPENKWNVDWQDYQTPMQLNWRNWGGGGFRLAPPPNISRHSRTGKTYRSVLDGRIGILYEILARRIAKWQVEGKRLFAGMTIGTELSMNASVTPADEFMPYGYRGVQDFLCPKDSPTCGTTKSLSKKELESARNSVLNEFLTDYAYKAVQAGIPKDRIYTHVWGDTTPEEKKYAPYALSSFNYYSNPGMSFYGSAQKPLDLAIFQSFLTKYRYPSWGAVEYSLPPEYNTWIEGLTNTLNPSEAPAGIVVVYNWDQIHDTPAIKAINDFVKRPVYKPDCTVPALQPTTLNRILDPDQLEWTIDQTPRNASVSSILMHIRPGPRAKLEQSDVSFSSTLPATAVSYIPDTEQHGIFTWFAEVRGCETKSYYSEPRIMVLTYKGKGARTPLYVTFLEYIRNVVGK